MKEKGRKGEPVVRGSVDTQAGDREENHIMKNAWVEQFTSRELYQLRKVKCGLITWKSGSLAAREISDRGRKLKLRDEPERTSG